MLMHPLLQWLISCVTIFIGNYYWALHDGYKDDTVTEAYVRTIYKDWHNLKSLMIVFVFISVKTIPLQLDHWGGYVPLLLWLFVKWFSWEFCCHSIPREYAYHGADSPWMQNIWFIKNKWLAFFFGALISLIGAVFIINYLY